MRTSVWRDFSSDVQRGQLSSPEPHRWQGPEPGYSDARATVQALLNPGVLNSWKTSALCSPGCSGHLAITEETTLSGPFPPTHLCSTSLWGEWPKTWQVVQGLCGWMGRKWAWHLLGCPSNGDNNLGPSEDRGSKMPALLIRGYVKSEELMPFSSTRCRYQDYFLTRLGIGKRHGTGRVG